MASSDDEIYFILSHVPHAWLRQAERLVKCSRALRSVENVRGSENAKEFATFIRGPELMLAGIAIETYLKAICLAHAHILKAQPATSYDKYLGPAHHNLLRLAEEAGVELVDRENAICEALTAFIEWFPRYPTARNRSKWKRSLCWEPEWDAELDSLTDRLKAYAHREADRHPFGAESPPGA